MPDLKVVAFCIGRRPETIVSVNGTELNYLARRAAMPISPQRRTVGDLAVRPTARVDRR